MKLKKPFMMGKGPSRKEDRRERSEGTIEKEGAIMQREKKKKEKRTMMRISQRTEVILGRKCRNSDEDRSPAKTVASTGLWGPARPRREGYPRETRGKEGTQCGGKAQNSIPFQVACVRWGRENRTEV